MCSCGDKLGPVGKRREELVSASSNVDITATSAAAQSPAWEWIGSNIQLKVPAKVLASRASGCHLDTLTLNKSPFSKPKKVL